MLLIYKTLFNLYEKLGRKAASAQGTGLHDYFTYVHALERR